MKRILPGAYIVLFLASFNAQALQLFIQGGLHIGGDKLASAQLVGGGTESIKAGELLAFSFGLISNINEAMELRTSLGIKLDGEFADNGELVFTRFPLEVMVFTTGEEVRFGAGMSYHLSPEVTIDLPSLPNTDVSFDDALGFVAQIEYRLGERGHIGLKATAIDYETSIGSTTADGNSLGFIIGSRF